MQLSLKYFISCLCVLVFHHGVHAQALMSGPEISLSEINGTTIENYLSKYVKYNSVSGNEKEAGEWLKSICIQNGLNIQQMGDTDGNYNFTASIYPLTS